MAFAGLHSCCDVAMSTAIGFHRPGQAGFLPAVHRAHPHEAGARRHPMEHKLLVPVRTTAAGTLVIRFGRLPSGKLTGLAFTSEDSLVRALGPSQQWTDLSWEALLDMLTPLGVEHVSVDPVPDGESETGSAPRQAVTAWPQSTAAARLAADDRPAGPPLARTAVLGGLGVIWSRRLFTEPFRLAGDGRICPEAPRAPDTGR
jgi:hypothetical protein